MAALGTGLTMILNDVDGSLDVLTLIDHLNNAGCLMAGLHHNLTLGRKAFIQPALVKPLKDILDTTKPGALLFGGNLTEQIKEAKAIENITKNVSRQPPVRRQYNWPKRYHLNWKSEQPKSPFGLPQGRSLTAGQVRPRQSFKYRGGFQQQSGFPRFPNPGRYNQTYQNNTRQNRFR